MITIRHTHEDGTLVYGTSKGDGVYELIGPRTAARFRYFPSIRMIGIGQSRDRPAKRWQINTAADALRAAGHEVEVEIDDTPRGVADVKADRAERLDARYERLTAKAERNMAEAESRSAAAHAISERFAGGQPILVGHHSERRARTDHKRMDGHMRAAVAAHNKAEWAAQAASVVGSAEAYRERPAVIRRRIDKTKAELRKVQHYIDGTRPANDWRGAYYAPERKPASGDWLEQLNANKAFLTGQLEADEAALAAHVANGYVLLDRESVHKGDTVTWASYAPGGATVTRVNPKTVTLDRRSYPRTLPYEQIKSVECPHENRAVTVGQPPRQPKREAPQVPDRAELPQAAEPVMVSAGTECFTSPPAVVERIIDAAELEPGMTVLEPSAGPGAIVSAVAPKVAAVDCIDINYQFADRLKFTAGARTVWVADFLNVPARAEYDRVLMNPPFRNQADIHHVTHALSFVKPGGRVVAVMSAGAEFRQDKTAETFRKLVADCGGWFERLPGDAFEASGTSVRTVLAVIPKEV